MPNGSNRSVKKLFRAIRSLCYCFLCWQENGVINRRALDFHHIKPTGLIPNGRGRGRKERLYDIINHADCYLPLCYRHHKREEERLKLGLLPSIPYSLVTLSNPETKETRASRLSNPQTPEIVVTTQKV